MPGALPPKLTELPASVFEDCDQLRSVRLPQGLRRVGSQAFVGCNSLAEIRLPDSVEEIREDAFGNLIGCIVASRGSYAYWWAMKNGVGVREP